MNKFQQSDTLTERLTQQISQILLEAVAARGHGYLVVSGGRTPIPFFQQLATQDLPWAQITVLLADDRWLPVQHEASNEALVHKHLLQHKAANATFVSLLSEHSTPTEGLAEVNKRLAALPCFDAVILGMGEDGHTASLFPESPQLNEGMTTTNPAVAITPIHAPFERISLSKTRLLNSHAIFFHLVGEAKKSILEQAMQPNAMLPASAFLLQNQVPVTVMLAVPEE